MIQAINRFIAGDINRETAIRLTADELGMSQADAVAFVVLAEDRRDVRAVTAGAIPPYPVTGGLVKAQSKQYIREYETPLELALYRQFFGQWRAFGFDSKTASRFAVEQTAEALR